MQRPTERQAADWLLALAPLVAANMRPEEARERIKAYVPNLVERFDSRDFSSTSREFVARNCRFFPSYGELCELLDRWPKPAQEQPNSVPDDTELDAMDRHWVAFWHRRRAELFAQHDGFKWRSREADLANLANLIQSQSRKAWAVISGVPESVPTPPSEAQIAHVARMLRPEMERTPKSQTLAMPPEPFRDVTAKGEHLAAIRRRCGLGVPVGEAGA